MTGHQPPSPRHARVARMAWILLDWAASAFSTVLITLVVTYVENLVFATGGWGLAAGVIWAWMLAAAMRLMTDDYRTQVLGSAVLGGALGIAGYLLAGPVPAALGGTVALNAAGVIGTLGGVAVASAALLRALRRGAPREAVTAPGA